MNKKFLNEQKKKSPVVDLTTRNTSVTFSIDRATSFQTVDFSAYDRLEDLQYTFTMSAAPAVHQEVKFTKWNKYITEYGTLDVGTLEYDQSITANLDVTGNIGVSANNKTTIVDGNHTSENTISAAGSRSLEFNDAAITGVIHFTSYDEAAEFLWD